MNLERTIAWLNTKTEPARADLREKAELDMEGQQNGKM